MLPASAGSICPSSRPKRDIAPLPRTVWPTPLLVGPAICSLPETRHWLDHVGMRVRAVLQGIQGANHVWCFRKAQDKRSYCIVSESIGKYLYL